MPSEVKEMVNGKQDGEETSAMITMMVGEQCDLLLWMAQTGKRVGDELLFAYLLAHWCLQLSPFFRTMNIRQDPKMRRWGHYEVYRGYNSCTWPQSRDYLYRWQCVNQSIIFHRLSRTPRQKPSFVNLSANEYGRESFPLPGGWGSGKTNILKNYLMQVYSCWYCYRKYYL